MKQLLPSILFGLCITSVSTYAADTTPPATLVVVSDVEQEQIAEQTWIPGTVVSRFDSRLTTEVSGVIKWVAQVGDKVNQGDVILKLDDAFLQLEQQQADANVSQLKTRVALLKRQQQRLEKLGKNAAQDSLDAKEADLAMAEQDLLQAKISLQRIELQLAKTSLRAPFNGTVVERFKQVGEFSQSSHVALRLVSLQDLEVKANAPLEHNQFNNIGDDVVIWQKSNQIHSTIRALIPVGDERSRTMEVRVDLAGSAVPIGSAVRVSIASSKSHQALTVHRDALILRQDKVYVNVIDEALTNKHVLVTPGSGFYDYIEVSGDLQVGQQVVVRGAENLRDGEKVRFKTPIANAKTLTVAR